MDKQRKAVALISGGLDSLLAVRVVQAQGIHVEGLNFFTGFCVGGHTHANRNKDRARPTRNNAPWAAERLGIALHFVDVVAEYRDVVLNPKYGYGANLNPCLDCKMFMVRKVGRHFRPVPQFKVIIAREEGEGRFLRGYRERYVALRTLSHKRPGGPHRRRADRGGCPPGGATGGPI